MALRYWTKQKRTRRLIVLMALDSLTDLDAADVADTTAMHQYLRLYNYVDFKRNDWPEKLFYALPLHGMERRRDEPLVPVHRANRQRDGNYNEPVVLVHRANHERENEGDSELLVPDDGASHESENEGDNKLLVPDNGANRQLDGNYNEPVVLVHRANHEHENEGDTQLLVPHD